MVFTNSSFITCNNLHKNDFVNDAHFECNNILFFEERNDFHNKLMCYMWHFTQWFSKHSFMECEHLRKKVVVF